jgi:hypothetical protein
MHAPRKATRKDAELFTVSIGSVDGGAVDIGIVDEHHGRSTSQGPAGPSMVLKSTPSSTVLGAGLPLLLATLAKAIACTELLLPYVVLHGRLPPQGWGFSQEVYQCPFWTR